MGLAERRAIKEFQESMYPELKKAIDKIAGFAVEVEVNWDTLAKDEMAHLYAECFPKVYFSPIVDAFRSVCQDDMGKKALKAGLKKVIICNVAGNYYGDSAVTFLDGVLQVDHDPVTNVDDVKSRTDAIRTVLEKKL